MSIERGEKLEELTKNLRSLRKSFSLTQRQVADKLNIKYQSYQAYETGEVLPDIKKLIILADIYDVSIDFLVGRRDI